MAYIISNECLGCMSCVSECPVSAISEKDGKAGIDAEACIECGACVGVCPVEAPQPEA